MRISQGFAGVAASMLLFPGLAACGGSNGGSSADSSSDEIVIGAIGAFSGMFAANAGGIPDVWKAWEESVNDAGGINGRTVKLIIKDIGNGDASMGLTSTKELIDRDKAVVIVDLDATDLSWIPYAEAKGVPVVAGTVSLAPLKYPTVFPTVLTISTLSYAYAEKVAEIGKTTAVYYPAEVPGAKSVGDGEALYSDELGFEVKISQGISSALPDYTSVCQAIKDANVDSYQLFFTTDLLIKMTDQCYKLGVKIPQILPAIVGPKEWTNPIFDGDPVIDSAAPFFDDSIPGVKEYRDTIEKYAPDLVDSKLDQSSTFQGYVAMKVLEKALRGVEGDVTTESIKDSFFTFKGETVGGITPPLTFTKGKPSSILCWFTWDIKDGDRVIGEDAGAPRCGPEEVLKKADDAVLASLG